MPGILSWDVFCRVIDNYGDAAVCWRLACQLAQEHGASVRLWIDDLATLHALYPEIDREASIQTTRDVEVRRWRETLAFAEHTADVVIEAFGCGLPESYVTAMAGRERPPLWITLEYLSAETWVAAHHGLPSPHPRFGIDRYFFFPGFTAGTGGVLREADLDARRTAYETAGRAKFWKSVGFEPPAAGALVVSLFAYAGAPVQSLLGCWERGGEPGVVAVPEGRMAEPVRAHFGVTRTASVFAGRRGNLEARVFPFLPQARYDELLWSCDVNFVRGEDSFVRAQWAERPFVWHIYPQEEGAHRLKLAAFLELYAGGLDPNAAESIRGLWHAWNLMVRSPVNLAEAWRRFCLNRAVLGAHARVWADRVAQVGDMATRLAQFARQRVK